LVWGENDPEVPLRDGELLHERIPGSRLIIFRRCGHLPHEEFPRSFTELVADFADDDQLERKRAVVG
jgi:pimeloyl-ACP methyl ester carboxylesterase